MMARECFAASVALRERASVVAQLETLALEPESSWRDREISELNLFLGEVDRMIVRHRHEAGRR